MFQVRVDSLCRSGTAEFCVRRRNCGTCSQSSCVEAERQVVVYFLRVSGTTELPSIIPCAEADFQTLKSHTILCAEAEQRNLKSLSIPSAKVELRHRGT